ITANTGMGQIRRTTSGATIRASTAIFPAPGGWWVAFWYGGADAQATAVAQASRATNTSNTQRPAARLARYPAGLSILMLAIVPPGQASDRRSRHAAAPMRTAAYPHKSAKPVHGDSAFCT